MAGTSALSISSRKKQMTVPGNFETQRSDTELGLEKVAGKTNRIVLRSIRGGFVCALPISNKRHSTLTALTLIPDSPITSDCFSTIREQYNSSPHLLILLLQLTRLSLL